MNATWAWIAFGTGPAGGIIGAGAAANGTVWLLVKLWTPLLVPCGCDAKVADGTFTGGGIGGNGKVWFKPANCWAGLLCPFATLYELPGTGGEGIAGAAAAVFWRAILARASNIEEVLWMAGAGFWAVDGSKPRLLCRSAGGLPGGVVEGSIEFEAIRNLTSWELLEVVVVFLLCALSFSLKEFSICAGKVWPFSQISMSFLIFSYKTKSRVSGSSYGKVQ
jgi:hypothetical protein